MIPSRRRFPDLPSTLPSNLEFVLGLSPSAMTLGLGNIRALLSRVGNPQDAFRTAVVAGTNGKGSVTAMTAALLSAQGLRTGRYTSPHVYSVTERVCVDGEAVTIDEMEAAAARITPFYPDIEFSYFEAITTIAFLVFAGRGVDVAVLEAGLGGRFDATNVTHPAVTVITSISLDHRRLLGDTVEEIILEKLGITRPGVPLLVGRLPEPLLAIARERGEREGFTVATPDDLAGIDVARAGTDGTDVTVRTATCDYGAVHIPFGGAHQVTNAVLAIAAAERVAGGPLRSVREGLENAYMPGRFERFEVGGKTYVLDVAHNEAALETSLALVGTMSPRDRTAVVFGLMRRKELFDVPRRALEAAARVYLAIPGGGRLGPPEAHEPHELLSRYVFRHLSDARTDVILWNRRSSDDDPWRRLADFLASAANPAEVVLVTGSHHVVEEFGRALFARGGVA